MEHSSKRHSRRSRHSGSSRHRSKDQLKKVRFSYALFAILLVIFIFNAFFHANKTFLLVEVVLAGLSYLISLQYVVANSSKIKTKELTLYLITYAIVAMGIVFFLFADKWSMTNMSQINGID
jgi:hypothetical protein